MAGTAISKATLTALGVDVTDIVSVDLWQGFIIITKQERDAGAGDARFDEFGAPAGALKRYALRGVLQEDATGRTGAMPELVL